MEIFKNIVCYIFFFSGWIVYFSTINPKFRIKINKKILYWMLRNWQSILWTMIYIVLVILSTIFVVFNWENCLDIEFFAHFNGYNIIWILWIFLLFIPLISVDNKWFKITSPFLKKEKEIEGVFQNAKKEEYAIQIDSLDTENRAKKENA